MVVMAKQRTWAVVIALGLTEPLAAAASVSSPAAPPEKRDIRLTLQARQALGQDPGLGPLNLSVYVRDGVATLWGPIHSPADGQRAMKAVQNLRGIRRVRSELFLAEKEAEIFTLPAPKPEVRHVASVDAEIDAITKLTTRPGKTAAPSGPVRLLAPIAADPASPAKPAETASLAAGVERIRLSNIRYRPIRAEVRGASVVLQAGNAGGEDVMALAQKLRRLPGVREVVVHYDP
jgi:hypothetical protein